MIGRFFKEARKIIAPRVSASGGGQKQFQVVAGVRSEVKSETPSLPLRPKEATGGGEGRNRKGLNQKDWKVRGGEGVRGVGRVNFNQKGF